MAQRRMLSQSIVMQDCFLDLPPETRCLYVTMCVVADDDGFVGGPKSVMRLSGATAEDLEILIREGYLTSFESGVVAINHWRVHNCIAKDRYHPTIYKEEKEQLLGKNWDMYTEDRIDKDRIDEVRKDQDRTDEERQDKERQDQERQDEDREDKDRQDAPAAFLESSGSSESSVSSLYRILASYHMHCPSLSSCVSLSDKVKEQLRRAISDGYSLEDFERVFQKAEQLPYLKGGGNGGWKAGFEWLTKPENMVKVLGGFYDPRNTKPDPVPMGASGVLGPAERESLRRIIAE